MTTIVREESRARHRGRTLLFVVAALLVLEMAGSMVWPWRVPRLAFLPRPASSDFDVHCVGHHREWHRGAVIWEGSDESHPVLVINCPD